MLVVNAVCSLRTPYQRTISQLARRTQIFKVAACSLSSIDAETKRKRIKLFRDGGNATIVSTRALWPATDHRAYFVVALERHVKLTKFRNVNLTKVNLILHWPKIDLRVIGLQLHLLCITQLTWADLAFLSITEWLWMASAKLDEKHPKLSALLERVRGVPAVAEWLAKRPVTQR